MASRVASHSAPAISPTARKLYFDEQRDMDPRYRIIYRLLPDEDKPTKAEVIRIGLKVPYGDEEQIYRQVGQALERLLGRD